MTIIFYAKDKAGNITYKEISITKSIGIPGYNLALLIMFIGISSVIVFLSMLKKEKLKIVKKRY
jgi:hypothetical protein